MIFAMGQRAYILGFQVLFTMFALFVLFAMFAMPVTLSAQYRQVQFDDGDMALDLAEALTFQKYPTYGQYVEMMQQFATQFPDICRLDTFGTSEEGRLLLALKISDNVGEDEAEANFLYSSTIHGNELVGFILLLRLADTLLNGYGKNNELTRLVDSLSIWINPLANPDGTYSAGNNLTMKNSMRFNVKLADLNRSFPDPGKAEPDDTTGRPTENRHMMQFMKTHGFAMSANIHSGEEVVNYPWDFTFDLHADDDWYRFISREYADEARAVDPGYMGLFTDGITNGAAWYIITGGRQDYVNYYLEGREVTLELSTEFLLGSDLLEEHWNINRRSLLNYLSQSEYGIRGRIYDKENGKPVRALIRIPDHDSTYSVVHSTSLHGDFYRLIKEGMYDLVVSAPGFLTDTVTGVSVTDYLATYLEVGLERDLRTGLVPVAQLTGFRLYPNPANGIIYLKSEGRNPGLLDIRVFSLEGQLYLHLRKQDPTQPVALQTEALPGGLYILHVTSKELSRSLRFIKQ